MNIYIRSFQKLSIQRNHKLLMSRLCLFLGGYHTYSTMLVSSHHPPTHPLQNLSTYTTSPNHPYNPSPLHLTPSTPTTHNPTHHPTNNPTHHLSQYTLPTQPFHTIYITHHLSTSPPLPNHPQSHPTPHPLSHPPPHPPTTYLNILYLHNLSTPFI